MARVSASSRSGIAALIRLADNPDFDDDDKDDEKEDKAEDDGPPWAKDEYDDGDEKEDKGKSVSGPKTKLMLAQLHRENAELRKSQQTLARGLSYLIENLNLADDGDDDDDDDKEDKGQARRPSARTISKDDAASSFGEQDNNTPGNRPYDQTVQAEDNSVIQGGGSAGPGPTGAQSPTIDTPYHENKGSLDARIAAMVDERVNKALSNPTIMKATAPAPGGGTSTAAAAMASTEDKADDLLSPFSTEARNLSFEDLTRLRIMTGAGPF